MKFVPPEIYQPLAKRVFLRLSRKIQAMLPKARIEHIGSSAIRGVWSKGDLDIFVGVASEDFRKAIQALKLLGFIEKLGTLRNRSLWPFVAHSQPLDVGIQLVANGSKFEFFREFRDLLRHNARLRAEYNELKLACSSLDSADYRRRKSQFIQRTLAENKTVIRLVSANAKRKTWGSRSG